MRIDLCPERLIAVILFHDVFLFQLGKQGIDGGGQLAKLQIQIPNLVRTHFFRFGKRAAHLKGADLCIQFSDAHDHLSGDRIRQSPDQHIKYAQKHGDPAEERLDFAENSVVF